MKYLLLILFCTVSLSLYGTDAVLNPSPSHHAFGNGEQLEYVISYKVSFVHTDVANVFFQTTLNQHNGQSNYTINAQGITDPTYRWFFDLHDTYVSRLDSATLRPVELTTELKEGKYRFSSRFVYDWNNKMANNTFRNHKYPNNDSKQVALREASYDALALFFNLRCADMAPVEKSKTGTMDLLLEDTIRTIRFWFLGREVKNVRGTGKFHTLKFRCQMATSAGESFEDGDEFTVWFTDDQNRIPIYLESPIRVGSIRARLVNWDHLKYPLTSKIN